MCLVVAQVGLVQTSARAVTVGSGACATEVNDSTGVTVTTSGSDCILTFTSTSTSYTWTTPAGISSAKVVVVAGGGGGGDSDSVQSRTGGGGGAGGYFSSNSVKVYGDINISVGAGGLGASSSTSKGSQGGDSAFGTLKAGGGGGGNSVYHAVSAANSGTGGTGYVSGGGGGGGRAPFGSVGAWSQGGAGGSAQSISFLGETYSGYAGESGGNYSDNLSGGLGGAITQANRTSDISSTSVVYAKSSLYVPWDSSSGQTYGSGGSPNYNYGNAETAGNELGGNGAQGVVIVRWQQVSTVLGTSAGYECVQYGSGITGAVVREGNYCLVAIKGPTVKTGSSGSWSVPNGVTAIDYLIVGGGGEGGNHAGGGAGAFFETSMPVTVSSRASIPVSIGEGGYTSARAYGTAVAGVSGSNSQFNGVTAFGGGGGASVSSQSTTGGTELLMPSSSFGGSGGGRMSVNGTVISNSPTFDSAISAGVGGTDLRRNAGGRSKTIYATVKGDDNATSYSLRFWAGSGGGGAGGIGGDVEWATGSSKSDTVLKGGIGGIGFVSTLISESSATALGIGEVDPSTSINSTYFAAGGGGGINWNSGGNYPDIDAANKLWAPGGLGGGGDSSGSAGHASPNTGGGGGGGTNTGQNHGGSGGSGVVLIRYVVPQVLSVTATAASSTEVNLTWTRPTSGIESITGYIIQKSPKGANTWTTAATTTINSPNTANGTTVTGLAANTEYDFRVTPVFATGSGVVSSIVTAATSRNTQTVSWAPTNISVLTTASPLTPSALATSNGDGAITYAVQNAGSTGCTVNSSTAVLNFSAAGTCVVRATAAQTSTYASAYVDVTFTITAPAAVVTPAPSTQPTTASTPTPSSSTTTNKVAPKKKTTKKPTPRPTPNPSTQYPTNTAQPTPKPSSSATSIPMNSQSATPTPSAVAPKSEFKELSNAPYPGAGLAIPDSGDIVTLVSGELSERTITRTAIDTKVELSEDQSIVFFTQSQIGESLPLNENGIIQVKDDARVFTEVTGFAPESPIEVWIFSTPTRLGGGYTNSMGDFTGQFILSESLPAGQHTLQLNGLNTNGEIVTVAIGITKADEPAVLGVATNSPMGWLDQVGALAFGAVVFLILFLVVRRKRESETEQ